jgi:hypothetical protein
MPWMAEPEGFEPSIGLYNPRLQPLGHSSVAAGYARRRAQAASFRFPIALFRSELSLRRVGIWLKDEMCVPFVQQLFENILSERRGALPLYCARHELR